jgi:hypothetical protein
VHAVRILTGTCAEAGVAAIATGGPARETQIRVRLEHCPAELGWQELPGQTCRTKVTELVEECRARNAEPLPRVVGEAAGVGLRASFRFVCD